MKYKTYKENYEETLEEARRMSKKNIKIALKQRLAMHKWAISAYEQALKEKN